MGENCLLGGFLSPAGLCCGMCEPGFFMARACTVTSSTVCLKCPDGFYSSTYSNNTRCNRCTQCDRGVVEVRQCTSTTNRRCRCKKGYYFDQISFGCKKCSKCQRGFEIKKACGELHNTQCIICEKGYTSDGTRPCKKTEKDVPSEGTPYSLIIAIVAIAVLIFVAAVIVWYCYKRLKRRERYHYNARNSSDGLSVTYDCATTSQPFRDVSVQSLRFEVISDLAAKLNPRARRNWKHLAAKMGYDTDFIRGLDLDKANATQDLLYDYGTRKDASVENLYLMLLSIKRKDAADILLPILTQATVV